VSCVFVLLDVIFAVSVWLVVMVIIIVVVVVVVVIINRSVKYSIKVSCTQFSLLHIAHFAYEI